MKKSSDQTFMLTKGNKCNIFHIIFNLYKNQKAHILQSALTPVRSVECGLFASTPALGSLQRISFLSVQ